MKKFVPGIDIEAENERISLGAWMFEETSICECSACGTKNYWHPTRYCPECGAMMLNFNPAKDHYDKYMEKITDEVKARNEENKEVC